MSIILGSSNYVSHGKGFMALIFSDQLVLVSVKIYKLTFRWIIFMLDNRNIVINMTRLTE